LLRLENLTSAQLWEGKITCMGQQKDNSHPRYVSTYINSYTINYLHYRNPWIPAWWSAAFPGYGHLMICKYTTGFLLISWEVIINSLAKINEAIYYSMVGDFPKAIDTLDEKWLLLYIAPYIFCIWDSYRRTVELNKTFYLAYHEEQNTLSNNISAMEINILERRKPYLAAVWSLIAPGLGHFYVNRLPTIMAGVLWLLVIIYFADLLPGIHATMGGNFEKAKISMDPQWLLFIPSIYGFIAYDAYVHAVEYNKLFERDQGRYLKRNYQDKQFIMPL
jgi:hypothetical protein